MCELCTVTDNPNWRIGLNNLINSADYPSNRIEYLVEREIRDMPSRIGAVNASHLALKPLVDSLADRNGANFEQLVKLTKDLFVALRHFEERSSRYDPTRDVYDSAEYRAYVEARTKLTQVVDGGRTAGVSLGGLVSYMTKVNGAHDDYVTWANLAANEFEVYISSTGPVLTLVRMWPIALELTLMRYLSTQCVDLTSAQRRLAMPNAPTMQWVNSEVATYWRSMIRYCSRCARSDAGPTDHNCTLCVSSGLVNVHRACCPHRACPTCNTLFSGVGWGPARECVTCARTHLSLCTSCGVGRHDMPAAPDHNWCQRCTDDNDRPQHCAGCCPQPRGISRKDWGLIKYKPTPKQMRRNKLGRLLGAEIEVCSVLDDTPEFRAARLKWKPRVMDDGSLGGGTSFEMPTQPAGGDLWLDMIADLGQGLATAKATVNQRAGLHVHVDCQDLNAWDLQRVFQNFIAVEDAIYDMIHPSRAANHYCKRSSDMLRDLMAGGGRRPKMAMEDKFYNLKESLGDLKGKERASERAATLKRAAGNKYMEKRYYGLNVHSFWHRGTLEFRHHHGTVNPSVITNWGLVVGSIVSFSAAGRTCKPGMAGLQEMATEMTGRSELADWIKLRTDQMKPLIGQSSHSNVVHPWL